MYNMHKFRIFALSILLLGGISIQEKVKAQPGVSISFQTFYNELSPYGRWINTPQYGSVWTPYVDAGFQPYSTNGYWEVTEFGNTWVSDYDWGWAPFHYGRWSFDDYNGWFWIPGYEWGPAWVNWRSGGGYYGWAPLGPGVNVNVSINIPSFWWVFVPQRYIATRGWYNYCAPRGRYNQIYSQTTIINNYYRNDNRTYVYGPRRNEIERVTGRSVVIRDIDRNRRGTVIVDRSNGRNSNYYGNDRGRTYNEPGNNSRYGYDNNSRRGTISGNNPGNRNNDYSPNNRTYDGGNGNNRGQEIRNDRDNRSSIPDRPAERATSERGYSTPSQSPRDMNRSRNQEQPGNYDNRSNRTYEQPRATPNVEQNRSRQSEPSYNSGRTRDYGNSERSSNSAPAVRSNPSERSSGESPRGGNGGGRSYENAGERGGRSPR
ncbi:hypothetical protein SAMN04487995_1123 [Dyadobacter koreensis]|uniref:Uncharacterized protein n=2 Tax=Dyadobacter koreensis TaxID=408657 RepID=A0A1H6R8S5_9BACT|nr:hypothetical protein SAMN04487995_1123 [Dyadobacter koreensis]